MTKVHFCLVNKMGIMTADKRKITIPLPSEQDEQIFNYLNYWIELNSCEKRFTWVERTCRAGCSGWVCLWQPTWTGPSAGTQRWPSGSCGSWCCEPRPRWSDPTSPSGELAGACPTPLPHPRYPTNAHQARWITNLVWWINSDPTFALTTIAPVTISPAKKS